MNLKDRIEQIMDEKVRAILDEECNFAKESLFEDPPAPSPDPTAPNPETQTPTPAPAESAEENFENKKLMGYICELLAENKYLYNSAHGYIQRLRDMGYKPRSRKKPRRVAFARIKEDLNL